MNYSKATGQHRKPWIRGVMNGIREFQRDDIGRVTELWMKVFRNQARPASAELQDYFRDIFFDSPWRADGLPALVYEDERRIVGFLGVIPRRMQFRGQSIRVAVATQLMVDESISPAYAAAKLLRRFLAGPQDLSLSDGANDAGGKLWRACGGEAAVLQSFNWTRVLRPAQYFQAKLRQRRRLAAVSTPIWPLAWALDAGLDLSGLGRGLGVTPPPSDELAVEPLTEATMMQCLAQLGGRRSLMPEYNDESLRWLLRRAADKQNHGELRTALLRRRDGAIAGWYLYYLRAGGMAQVLQFGARPDQASAVINQLFHRAWSEGATAVTGGMDPRYAAELAAARCGFSLPGYGVLMHSRRPELGQAIHAGDAFLSRLEGEWWARFSDAIWSVQDKPPGGPARELPRSLRPPQFTIAH
jgi:hypothetical protein